MILSLLMSIPKHFFPTAIWYSRTSRVALIHMGPRLFGSFIGHRACSVLARRAVSVALGCVLICAAFAGEQPKHVSHLSPQLISSDASVKYDYDIAYVRAPRRGDDQQTSWPDVYSPIKVEPGADLMLLHPDGSEEVLVKAGADQAVTDPFVSFDAKWIFYALFDGIHREPSGQAFASRSDIYKVNVKTRQIVRLTHQEYTPNTGVAKPGQPYGVFNLGPCPLPDGQLMFTSNRNGFVATKNYKIFSVYKDEYKDAYDLQLFRMNDDGMNVETVGHLNVNSALHPTPLKDGRVMFTSFETQGLRDIRTWAIWTINPDGTGWAPLVSALGASSETARHFMTQLSDGHIVWEHYYFQRNMGFGTFYKMDASVPPGQPFFSSAARRDPRSFDTGSPCCGPMPFTPHGLVEITPFSHFENAPAYLADPASERRDPKALRLGKVTQPSGAPNNNLLTVYAPGPVYGFAPAKLDDIHAFIAPAIDSGIYLIKGGAPVEEPAELLLIKNDPRYNEQWPRAVVPYKSIYGVDSPARITPLANDGKLAKALPVGTPFGLVGSSSLYKRESYPRGRVPDGKVTAEYSAADAHPVFGRTDEADPYEGQGALTYGVFGNWFEQGAEAGKYSNDEVQAIRILIEEPTTDPITTAQQTRKWWNASNERLRILGEIPVRKFAGGRQPLDPDGNPDTSFLAKIPADVPWTLQTLDKNGMVLNAAQTWHQLRPGEERNDCGGCHAHSQKPTLFQQTAAAAPAYQPFDLTRYTSLLTSKQNDESHQRWDTNDETGVRYQSGVKTVEFFRDVKPILDRSCVACHTKNWAKPAGNLVLDDDTPEHPPSEIMELLTGIKLPDPAPGPYFRLALDHQAKYGYKPVNGFKRRASQWDDPQASRYVRYFQARRSLLVWKLYGRRLDGWKNEDFAYETVPGNPHSMVYQGKPFAVSDAYPGNRGLIGIAYLGTQMPPPEAVAGTFIGPDGRTIKVPALSDEDKRTIARWIDLGCPIDLDFDPQHPEARGHGWLADDKRPTLTLTYPRADANPVITRILIGAYDYDSGVDPTTLDVRADFEVNGIAAGKNLAGKFKNVSTGVWELRLAEPISILKKGKITVAVKDHTGNLVRLERIFSVEPPKKRTWTETANTYLRTAN